MIHDFATLSVKKIVPTVIATVPDKKEVRKINETGGDGFFMFFFFLLLVFLLGMVGERNYVTSPTKGSRQSYN